jgi:polar amino acid transport system ATP-binding protein
LNLNISKLSKSFGELSLFDSLSLSLTNIKSLALVGPSGGGKTTLLRMIAELEPVDSGQISLDRVHKGVVFQSFNLFPHFTALQNIVLPLTKVHGIDQVAAEEQANQLLERFNLKEHAHKKPSQLSGGQQQRIAICRAVATKPDILLFDEPTSALDPEYTAEVLDLVAELREEGMEIIFVTHEMGFARKVADHILFIGEGDVLFSGKSQEFFGETAPERIKTFLGKIFKYVK